jgi:iron complex outermembrane receptor protein
MEASVTGSHSLIEWVGGAALRRDGYRDRDASGFDYGFVTSSAFAQATLAAGRQVSASVTGRCDHHSRYGAACVPLAAILFKQAAGWSERLTAGLGDYAPTPITEETQATGLSRFRPFVGPGAPAIVYERARHATLDVGFHKGPIDLNATVYATRIANPLEVRDFVTGPLVSELVNASGPMNSRGLDLFAVYNAEPVAITVFYGLARTREERTVSESPETEVLVEREVPLNPRIRGGLDVALDLDETGTRLTAEAYYTGKQAIDDDPYRSVTRPFTTVEFLATQNVGSVQLFLSAENLTNVRQTSFDPLLLPAMARNGRWTTDAWAPLEGRTLRAGLRARL